MLGLILSLAGDDDELTGELINEIATCPYCGKLGVWLQSFTTMDDTPSGWEGAIRMVHFCGMCQRSQSYLLQGQPLLDAWADNARKTREHITARDPQVVADVAMHLHLGDYEGVKGLLKEIEESGDLVTAHIARGRAWQLCGNLEWAEKHIRAAADLNPPSPAARLWLGRFLLETERDQAGISELQRAAAMDRGIRYLPFLAGMFYLRERNKHWVGVQCIGEEVLRLDPQVEQDRATMKTIDKARRKLGRDRGRNPYEAR